jgi:hypothetical protein
MLCPRFFEMLALRTVEVQIGDARTVLPELLRGFVELESLFMTVPSCAHMRCEFTTAYAHRRSRAIRIEADALWNLAFREFVDSVDARQAMFVRGVDVLCKDAR